MPLLAYFSVVGTVLLALLFVAEARLGPPTSLSISTNFYGLPAPYKAPKAPSTPVLTVRDAPEPDTAAMAFAQHTSAPTTVQQAAQPQMSGEAPLKIRVTKAPAKKKVVKQAPEPPRNLFAASGPASLHRVW
jgi:hypothetical protein